MENQITILNENDELIKIVDESGLEKTKGQQLLNMFTPYFQKMAEIEAEINSLNLENPTADDSKKARAIRLKLKDNRVDTKHEKDSLKRIPLAECRLIDAFYNIVDNTSKPLELKCDEVEKFAAKQEVKRVEELRLKRSEELAPFGVNTEFFQLGLMPEEVYNSLLANSKAAFETEKENKRLAEEQRIVAEKKAEEERIAREKADAEERERLRLENIEKQKQLETERLQAEEKRKDRERIAALERLRFRELSAVGFVYPGDGLGLLRVDNYNELLSEKTALYNTKLEEDKKAKAEAEAKAKEEKAKREAAEKELEAKRKAEEKARKEAEAKLVEEEKARKAALKAPDKTKLEEFANKLDAFALEIPLMKSEEGTKIVTQTLDLLGKTVNFIREKSNTL